MKRLARTLLWSSASLLMLAAAWVAYNARQDLAFTVSRAMLDEQKSFTRQALPLTQLHHLFDLGIVDADGNGRMDWFTSNHNYRQVLMLAGEDGQSRDVLTDWGLDQNPAFPAWEQSFASPTIQGAGLYIYWLGESLVLRGHGLEEIGQLSGTLRMFSAIDIRTASGFTTSSRQETTPESPIAETIVEFSADTDGMLELVPPSRGVPTRITLEPGFPLDRVFVGGQRATPVTRSFSPFLRDRHGHAWADINGDGQLDVYISRGGVGGSIRILPDVVRNGIRDELLISGRTPRFTDVTDHSGIQKKDCSGRHVRWVDFDGDGRLDLFVNCQNRKKAQGLFPKQLWRQDSSGRFRDVAVDVGLALTDGEIIDFIWLDADGDGDADLFTSEDQGFFLYRNHNGKFTQESQFRPAAVRADVDGLSSEVSIRWRFDGKLTVADFDADGKLDVFASSKLGNVLLVNDGGTFRPVDPASIGLPAHSLNGVWVDYDNDGRVDLFTVPDGLYRQSSAGRFERTGLLAVMPHLYQAAIVHWYDMNSDGKRDMLLALNENPGLWRWWQKPYRDRDDAFVWRLRSYRNNVHGKHWLHIDVDGPWGNRQAIGAEVVVTTPQGRQAQTVGINDSSFFSQGHYRLYFGLGDDVRADRISVRWSDGHSVDLTDVAADRLLTIEHPQPTMDRSTTP